LEGSKIFQNYRQKVYFGGGSANAIPKVQTIEKTAVSQVREKD